MRTSIRSEIAWAGIVVALVGYYIGSRHRKFVMSARPLTRMEMRKLFPPSEAKNFLRKVKA